MGNSLGCRRRKKKAQEADNKNQSETITDSKTVAKEDVLYASIDHSNLTPERPLTLFEENDCDYAIVKIPNEAADRSKHKSTEDCSDDYVLMG